MVDAIDIVVVNYKRHDLTKQFLDSFFQYEPSSYYTLTVIDNEGDYGMAYRLKREYPGVLFYIMEQNLGYARACNFGVGLNDNPYVVLFNNDMTFINDNCIDLCIDYLKNNDDVAVVGPLQYSSNGKVTHGGIFGTLDKPEHRQFGGNNIDSCRDVREAVTVSGSAYFTKRSIWNEMQNCSIFKSEFPEAKGAFPPFPHFFEETLYSYHISGHGYKCVYLGTAEMIHEWHQSSPHGSQDENFKYGQKYFRQFCSKHGIPCD